MVEELNKNIRFLIILLDDIWRLAPSKDEADVKKSTQLKQEYRELIHSVKASAVGELPLDRVLTILESHQEKNVYNLPEVALKTIFRKLEIDFTTMYQIGVKAPKAAGQTASLNPQTTEAKDKSPEKTSDSVNQPPSISGEEDEGAVYLPSVDKPAPVVSASKIQDNFSKLKVSEEMKEAGHHFTKEDLMNIVRNNGHLRTGARKRKEGKLVLRSLITAIRQQDPEKISGLIQKHVNAPRKNH